MTQKELEEIAVDARTNVLKLKLSIHEKIALLKKIDDELKEKLDVLNG